MLSGIGTTESMRVMGDNAAVRHSGEHEKRAPDSGLSVRALLQSMVYPKGLIIRKEKVSNPQIPSNLKNLNFVMIVLPI